ncbi:unnamed protein product [Dicrocoelium dendriticum]|nr:unnamed protein product [Dicrocoelium dendriticum]
MLSLDLEEFKSIKVYDHVLSGGVPWVPKHTTQIRYYSVHHVRACPLTMQLRWDSGYWCLMQLYEVACFHRDTENLLHLVLFLPPLSVRQVNACRFVCVSNGVKKLTDVFCHRWVQLL